MPSSLETKRIRVFLIFLAIVSGCLLRFRTPEQARELLIVPDGVEYTVSAVNLIEGRGYTITLGGQSYSPRAPFGYSLCLVPFFLLFGKALGNGIFCTLFFSVTSAAFLFLLARFLFDEEAAFWAVLFFTFSPIHLYWSRQIMADIPFSSMVLLCFWFYFKRPRTFPKVFLLGVIFGMGCWLKYVGLLFIFPMFISFFGKNIPIRKKFFSAAVFLAGLIPPLFLLLKYNQSAFGGFLKTGFSFWTPEWTRLENMLSPSYAFREPRLPVGGSPNFLVFGKFLLGCAAPWHQNPYPFFIVPFVGAGMMKILRDRGSKAEERKEFLFLVIATIGIFFVFFSFYFAQNMRYFMPIVPFLLIIAGVGFDHFFKRRPVLVQRGFLLFAGITLIVSPLAVWKMDQKTHAKQAYVRLIQRETGKDAHIVTGWDPVSFFHEIQRGSQRVYVPISEEVEYVHKPFRLDPKRKIFFAGISTSKAPLYVDNLSCQDYPEECKALKGKFHFQEIGSEERVTLFSLQGR